MVAPVNASSPTSEQKDCRLEIMLPKLRHYNVDNVLQVIAAEWKPYLCGQVCPECSISRDHDLKPFAMIHDYNCDGLRERHYVLRYLGQQVKKFIDLGKFQVWNLETGYAQEFPYQEISSDLTYFNFKNWLRSVHIYPEDLSVFLTLEKIRITFYATDENGEIISDLIDDDESQCQAGLVSEDEPEKRQVESSRKVIPIISANKLEANQKRQQRLDNLAVEIDEILRRDPEMTPTQVNRVLMSKIGSGNTCIVDSLNTGLRWRNGKGEMVIASISNVSDRVARWKKSNR